MSSSSQHRIIPLDDYAFPDAPALNQAEAWFNVIRQKVTQARSDLSVTEDHLTQADLSMLEELLPEPVCHPLLDSLNDKYAKAGQSESFLELLVIPPCDSAGIVARWARQHNFQVLEPPSREALCAKLSPELPSLEGEGLLVIPRLEHWFMRHFRGLRHVRALLRSVRQSHRPVLVSCNSWCWRYLSQVVDADLILPDPVTFEAFDAHLLRDWLHELSIYEGSNAIQFLDVRDGKDVMEGQGDDISERFIELADLSSGIPWVAWQVWRRCLRTVDEREAEKQKDDEGNSKDEDVHDEKPEAKSGIKTLWLTSNSSPLLPPGHESESHRLLHALLIHDSLSVDELADVLPTVEESYIAPALIRAGFIEIADNQLRVRASAYPAVRSSLSGASIPQGAI